MRRRLLRMLMPMVLISLISSVAYGQGGATSLSGSVTDTTGAIIPGADVVAKNAATNATFTGVSNEKGDFSIPAMPPGTYTVTVTLMGFKQAVLPNVTLNAAVPGTIKVALEIGALAETVVVQGGAEIVQTQSSTIATTLNATQLTKLPLVSRDAMNMITFLPGVDTSTTNRASTISGLPQNTINISIDGVNTQDNMTKTTDGYFSLISPRLDAVEEVTVTTAAQSADSGGQGAVQIRFVTRSGTNQFSGSGYYYLRDPRFNSNYWFNNRDRTADASGKAPRDQVKLYEPGARFGGPVMIPGLYNGRDKAFFFVNYEQFRQPNPITRTRTVINPTTQQGIYQYTASGGTQRVDLFALARANGQLATADPTVARLLADISASTAQGTLNQQTDPNLMDFLYTSDSKGKRHYPTWRLDYNLSQNNRLSYTSWFQKYATTPDTLNNADASFPGFPNVGNQTSNRLSWSTTLRSTLGANLVNQVIGGYSATTTKFSTEYSPGQFEGNGVGGQNGFNLNINRFSGLRNATSGSQWQSRETPSIQIEDTLTWLKGSHSLSFGGSFTHIGLWDARQTVVPQIDFGVVTGDPALAMFTAANFPGASAAQLTAAQNLYAVLTGRVSAVNASVFLDENTNQYGYLAPAVQRGQLRELGFSAQDSWRLRKNMTLNYGVRYELQLPFTTRNNSYSTASLEDIWGVSGVGNLFKPGVLTGSVPTYERFDSNTRAYETDWNNVAPSLGLTYRPSVDSGFLRPLLGASGDTVLRAAFSLAYSRNGMGDFTGVYSLNPGRSLTANRTQALGNLVTDGGTLPLLLRDSGRLGAPSYPAQPTYPLLGVATDTVATFERDLQVPYAETWTAGIQRAVTRNSAVEVRYVGTRNLQGWTTYDMNEVNILENGFLDEFKKAQANLQANIAAGRGNTFAYTGAAGTSPLPIFLAHYNGLNAAQAGNTAAYSGTNWNNTTFLGYLAQNNPQPYSFASTNATNGLLGNATFRNNSLAAGLPANFFVVNPNALGGARLTGNGGFTRYDSMQIEARRRLANGFLLEANYVLAKQTSSSRYSFRVPRVAELTEGPRHAFKVNWVFELPFGNERKFFSGVPGWLDRVIGGWEFDGNGRVQSGRILDFGNVRLVGMSEKELQSVYTIEERVDPQSGRQLLFILPQDIIDNTIKAFSVSATSATGYGSLGAPTGRYFAPANGPDCIQVVTGDCAPRTHFVTGPAFVRFDMSAVKRVRFAGRTNVEFRAEFLNALNNINFTPVAQTGTGQAQNQVIAAYRDVNNTQDPGGRLVQFVFRLNF